MCFISIHGELDDQLLKSPILNNLLRFNIALAIDTGLLDIAENLIMTHNIPLDR